MLWLITTYEDDAGHLPAQRSYAACVQAGYRMILKAYPRGGAGDAINRLSERFFEHALSAAGAGEARPQYIGDHVNNVVLPVAEAGWIPREQAVPLPTRELAKAWEGAPD